jgi:hypothetical protein
MIVPAVKDNAVSGESAIMPSKVEQQQEQLKKY